MNTPRIYADLNKWEQVNGQHWVILTTQGTHKDLEKYGIALREGLSLSFWMDDADDDGNFDPLHFEGVIHYDKNAAHWVAVVDWDAIHNASEEAEKMTTPIRSTEQVLV